MYLQMRMLTLKCNYLDTNSKTITSNQHSNSVTLICKHNGEAVVQNKLNTFLSSYLLYGTQTRLFREESNHYCFCCLIYMMESTECRETLFQFSYTIRQMQRTIRVAQSGKILISIGCYLVCVGTENLLFRRVSYSKNTYFNRQEICKDYLCRINNCIRLAHLKLQFLEILTHFIHKHKLQSNKQQ